MEKDYSFLPQLLIKKGEYHFHSNAKVSRIGQIRRWEEDDTYYFEELFIVTHYYDGNISEIVKVIAIFKETLHGFELDNFYFEEM